MTLFEMATWTVLALLVGAMVWADWRKPDSFILQGSLLNRVGNLALMSWLLLPFAILITIALSVVYLNIT